MVFCCFCSGCIARWALCGPLAEENDHARGQGSQRFRFLGGSGISVRVRFRMGVGVSLAAEEAAYFKVSRAAEAAVLLRNRNLWISSGSIFSL